MEVMVESAGLLAGMHLHAGAYIVTSGKTVVIIPASQDKQQLALHWNTGTASIFWWSILDKGVHELVAL